MATTGSERGLTLRSPGPVHRRRRPAGRPGRDALGRDRATRGVRDELAQAWMDAEAYRLYTLRDVTDIVDGRSPGARSSLNKVWWSELDVRAARDRARPARPAGRAVRRGARGGRPGRVDEGLPVLAVGSDLRRAPTRSSATSIAERVLGLPAEVAADALRLHRRPAPVPRHRARPAGQGVPARAGARRLGRRRRPAARRVGGAGRDGRARRAGPRGARRARARRARPRAAARGDRPRRASPIRSSRPCAVAAPLLAEASESGTGSRTVAERWLPAIAAGEAIVAVDLDAGAPVSHGRDADLVVALRDDRLVAVPGGARRGRRPSPRSTAPAPWPRVDWSPADEMVIAVDAVAAAAVARARDRGALGTAAQLLGLGQQLLDLTVAYVKERQQFGVPIGSFQAVKHHLADAAAAPRVRPPGRVRRGLVAGDRPARRQPRRVARQGGAPRRRPLRRPRRRCSATAPSATRSSTTCTST